jgi:hypothetical protein
MGVGIRTRDLRKIYTTPPPLAARMSCSSNSTSPAAPTISHAGSPVV